MFCPAVQVEIFRAIKAAAVAAIVYSSLLQAVMFVATAMNMPAQHEVTYLIENVGAGEGDNTTSGLVCNETDGLSE